MDHALVNAPEHPASWVLWLLWVLFFVFAFPSRLEAAQKAAPLRMPFVSWGHVERTYDPGKETSFEGTIQKVRMFRFMAKEPAVGVEVSRGDQRTLVLIAPSSFLSGRGIAPGKGLHIKGSGAAKPWKGGRTIIAREITLQGRTLLLRDKAGKPIWSGADPGKADARIGK